MTPSQPPPRERCRVHGLILSPAGACLRCEAATSPRARRAPALLMAGAALVGLLAAGVAVARGWSRAEVRAPEPVATVTVGADAVTERGVTWAHPPSIAPPAPKPSADTRAVLTAWNAELAEAEATRAKELAEAEAVRAAAEKKQIEDAYELPKALATRDPAPKHGRILKLESEYGEHDWVAEAEGHYPTTGDVLPTGVDAVKVAPPASDFIVVPLHMVILRSDTFAALNASPDLEGQMPGIVEDTNRILAAAGVSLELKDVTVVDADNTRFEQATRSLGLDGLERPPARYMGHALPALSRQSDGLRVFFAHDFHLNGVCFPGGNAVINELALSHPVRGTQHETIPRVIAHELGHALGLGHVSSPSYVMAGAAPGRRLGRAEAARAHAGAAARLGAHPVDPSNPPPAVLAVAGQRIKTP